MARIVIDPDNVEEQRHFNSFVAAIEYARDRGYLKHYHALDEEEQAAWRAEHPLIRRMHKFVDVWTKKEGFG